MSERASGIRRKHKRDITRGDRKMAAESERGADDDGARPGWREWSLIKMFFN